MLSMPSRQAFQGGRHTFAQSILLETLHSEHLDTLSVLRLDGRKVKDGSKKTSPFSRQDP
jgi:hypothetical protein